jgi:N-acetylglutamate synthase-like GNAT family acetyltransferase
LDENTIFCLEAYLDGHEVDVDLVLYNGVLMYSTVSDNFNTYLPYGLETGHLMPSILPKYIQRSIAQKAYESVKACGHDRGVFHVELMLQPNGDIFVIEINGRLGGMYIANWHETLFGVDLIKAELAIARDMNPSCFLKKKQTQRAFAQLCVTTNNEKIMKIDGTIEVYKWTNFGPVKGNRENYLVEKWVEFPYIKNVNKNGHPNLGAITVEAKTPLLAFQKLAKTVDQQPPILQTNYGLIESSTKVLRQFCSKIPSIINRYKIRITTQKDKKYIVNLLSYLTNSVTDSNPTKLYIPHDTAILVMEDKMHIKCPIIATIGLHFWNRMRPNRGKSCYIHDLVVTPTYRNLLLGTRMMHSALTLAKNNQVHKMELACDASLDYFYHKFGFSNVGSHLVKYMEGDEKKVYPNFSNKSELEKKGAWLYGQHIVQNYLKPIDPMLIIPKHFFIPKTGNHSDTLEDVYKHKQLYFVKYSLKGANAFSPLCQRGENSSRNRQLNTTNLNKSQIRRELKLLLKQAPQSAAGIVLQTAIDQSIGCLFHAEMSKSQIEIDMLAEKSTKRAYALSRGGVVIDYAEIPGNSNFENWKEACQKLVKRCDNYFNFLKKKFGGEITWSIEGFWRPNEEITILQLRPTPNDKPIPTTKNLKKFQIIYKTVFTWGDYKIGPIQLRSGLQNGVFVLIRSTLLNEKMEQAIIDHLAKNINCLLIDPFRGFALSHEKWFLAPCQLRKNFAYIHIPKHIIEAYKDKPTYIFSIGNKGYCALQRNSPGTPNTIQPE